eukprot:6446555-Amphidinium_carterae.1
MKGTKLEQYAFMPLDKRTLTLWPSSARRGLDEGLERLNEIHRRMASEGKAQAKPIVRHSVVAPLVRPRLGRPAAATCVSGRAFAPVAPKSSHGKDRDEVIAQLQVRLHGLETSAKNT